MKDLSALEAYRLPDDEIALYGIRGDGGNGIFKVYVAGRSFLVVASNGGGWEHVSVSPCNRKRQSCPTWDEMCVIKDMFFAPEERVVQYHPPQSEYVNMHPYTLHLWRPVEKDMPYPPMIFI